MQAENPPRTTPKPERTLEAPEADRKAEEEIPNEILKAESEAQTRQDALAAESLLEKMRSNAREATAEKNPVERKLYQIESGETIEVTAKTFDYLPKDAEPTSESRETEQNVVFLPGWKMAADSAAVEKLGTAFAERSRGKAFAVTTRSEEMPAAKDGLYKEAMAISRFIKEKGLTNVVLAGHSQGGDKAIDLATILQQDPELRLKGLLLLDAVGLYEQEPKSLAKDFVRDSLLNTPVTMFKKLFKNPGAVSQSLKAGNSIVGGIFKEMAKSGSKSLERMKGEVQTMARQNPRLNQIQVPVILMAGVEDLVSDPGKIIPQGEEERILAEWEQKDAEAGTETFIDPREKFLQEEVFPQSPYIRMVVPEKMGHHGLPLFRSESVANASLYLLKRFERRSQEK